MLKIKNAGRVAIFLIAAVLLVAALGLTAFAGTPFGEFTDAVNDIKNATSLAQKASLIEAADAKWAGYLSSVDGTADAEAEEAYSEYVQIKSEIQETVESCDSFMEYVFAADEAWNGAVLRYDDVKDAIEAATELYDKIDITYEGVSSAKTTYENLIKEIDDCEKPYRLYITAVENALTADNYKAKKQAMNEVSTREKEIAALAIKLNDYPGYSEAVAGKAQVTEQMEAIMAEASEFINAVQVISAEELKDGIKAALEIYEGIDSTADGVSAAKTQLDSLKNTYDGAVKESSEAADDMCKLIFGCLIW